MDLDWVVFFLLLLFYWAFSCLLWPCYGTTGGQLPHQHKGPKKWSEGGTLRFEGRPKETKNQKKSRKKRTKNILVSFPLRLGTPRSWSDKNQNTESKSKKKFRSLHRFHKSVAVVDGRKKAKAKKNKIGLKKKGNQFQRSGRRIEGRQPFSTAANLLLN